MSYYDHEFTELLGKTFSSVENNNNEELIFVATTGEAYRFYHEQDCCENVEIVEIVGELSDLVGAPMLMAEEVTHENETPPEVEQEERYYDDSFTWTFYKFATIKGYVTVRWLGESNGYYSEEVYFDQIGGEP